MQNGVPVEMRIIMPDKYDALKLENQLCFPLYACSKEIVRKYKPFLDELDLTYTQYIAMMVLWEHRQISVKDMGALLYLDSGTLTPVLKKLEQKGYLIRDRNWRRGHFELDIVAAKDNELIVVEVKTRSDTLFAAPEDAVDLPKIKRTVRAADAYIRLFQIDTPVRFDIITVVGNDGNFKVEHIEEAFYPPLY